MDRSLPVRSISWRSEKAVRRASCSVSSISRSSRVQKSSLLPIDWPFQHELTESNQFLVWLSSRPQVLSIRPSTRWVTFAESCPPSSNLSLRCRSPSHDAIHVRSTQKDIDEEEKMIRERKNTFSFAVWNIHLVPRDSFPCVSRLIPDATYSCLKSADREELSPVAKLSRRAAESASDRRLEIESGNRWRRGFCPRPVRFSLSILWRTCWTICVNRWGTIPSSTFDELHFVF